MAYKYIEFTYPQSHLFHKELFWINKNCNCYFAFKLNDTDNWTYYAGNASHGLETGKLLTSYALEADAITNYLTTVRDTTSGKVIAVLPLNFQAKYARIYIESGSAVRLFEWQPSIYITANEIISGTLEVTDQLSDSPKVTVVSDGVTRLKLGNIVATSYGLAGYNSSAATIFELSNRAQNLAGWDFTATHLTKNNTTISNTGFIKLGTGNDVAYISAANATYREWIGHENPASAPLRITKGGKIYADGAQITGTVYLTNMVMASNLAASSVTTTKIAVGAVTAAKINVVNLAAINANLGAVDAGYIHSSSLFTKGTYLTTSCTATVTTLQVGSTVDFAASGSSSFIDSANDRDAFTYTGKTATTLTGCVGVLAHTVSAANKPLVVPAVKGMYISDAVNEMRFFGDRGDGAVEELACIGIFPNGSDNIIGAFGNSTSKRMAIRAQHLNAGDNLQTLSYITAGGLETGIYSKKFINLATGTNSGHFGTVHGLYVQKNCGVGMGGNLTYGTVLDLNYSDADPTTPYTATILTLAYTSGSFSAGATIGTSQELFLGGWTGGTVTNRYAINQASAISKNFFAGSIEIGDGKYLGLGAASGRILFAEAGATDTITISDANLIVGSLTLPTSGTAFRLPVYSAANVMTELAAVGATGQYLAGNTGAIPSWATVASILPWLIDIDVFSLAASHTNLATFVINPTLLHNGYRTSTAANQNAEVSWPVVLGAGTWTIELLYTTYLSYGIVTVYLDAVSVGTIDMYTAGAVNNVFGSITGISVTPTAKYTLKLKMETKNAASSGYNIQLQHVKLLRTA